MRLFIAVFLLGYGGLSFYGGFRWLGTLHAGYLRSCLVYLSFFCALAYPLGRGLSHVFPEFVWLPLIHAGEFWLALLPHLVIPALIWDLYRLFLLAFKRVPGSREDPRVFFVWTAVFLVIFAAGSLNAAFPVVKKLDLNLSPEKGGGELRAALITDLHVGPTTSSAWIDRLVSSTNATSPDVILIGGDIMDAPDSSRLLSNVKKLGNLSAPMGVYSIPGNHEYYFGIEKAEKILERTGIPMLRDERFPLGDVAWLVGREDIQAPVMGYARVSLSKLMPHDGKPVIVMDHTPLALKEAASTGADLLLCGHAHHGQIFPFQLITGLIFNPDWGLRFIGKTTIYVSCGAGVWGPPIRTSSRPEIVVLNLRF